MIKNLATPEDLAQLGKKPSKYGNQKTVVDGLTFDSKGEADRWIQLTIEEAVGAIGGLQRQVRYRIEVGGIFVCTYVADFVYTRRGRLVIEDFKGMRTPIYRLKKRLMWAVFGIAIFETGGAMGIVGGPKVLNPEREHDTWLTPLRLCQAAIGALPSMSVEHILDPGCGTGNWGRAALMAFPNAYVSGVDIRDIDKPADYDYFSVRDYLTAPDQNYYSLWQMPDLIIGNPPYSLGEAFVDKSMKLLKPGGRLLFLMPLTYLAGQKRFQSIHQRWPIEHVWVLPERPSFSGDGKTAVGKEFALYLFTKGNRLQPWMTCGFLDWSGRLSLQLELSA